MPDKVASPSLTLVCDPDHLVIVAQSHGGRVLFRADRSGLGLVLHESQPLPAGNQPDLPEPFEPPEDGGQAVDVIIFGQILHEEDLVRR